MLTSLKRGKSNLIDLALNEVRKGMSDRYYDYGYYGKYYSKYCRPSKSWVQQRELGEWAQP